MKEVGKIFYYDWNRSSSFKCLNKQTYEGFLVRQIPYCLAMKILLTGEQFSTQEAKEMGLIRGGTKGSINGRSRTICGHHLLKWTNYFSKHKESRITLNESTD